MSWEDEETRDAPAWDWDGAAARGWPQRQDDRQQADLCGYCRTTTPETDRIEDPTRPNRVAHTECVMRFAAAKGA